MEHDEQVALFQFIKAFEHQHPALKTIYAIPNGGHRSKAVAGKLKAEGVKSGVWDIHLPMASAEWSDVYMKPVYIGLWIEMKYGKGRLTPNQKEWQSLMEERGHKCVVCYSWQEAVLAIGDYLDIKFNVSL